MGSLQNKIKNFERYYGVHLRSLRRSRRFMTFFLVTLIVIIFLFFRLAPKSKRTGLHTIELENCIQSTLDKYAQDIKSMNVVVNDEYATNLHDIKNLKNNNNLEVHNPSDQENAADVSENDKYFLPYTGNGYIGVSLFGKNGLYSYHQKSLSLKLNYNPLAQIYSDTLSFKEIALIEFNSGFVHKIQCYQHDKECILVQNTVYAHRTRPSVLIEEIVFNNPSKEAITLEIIQIGMIKWNQSKTKIENINGAEFTITSGIIDTTIENKQKHLCVTIGSTRLATHVRLKETEFNTRHTVITVVKYSSTFLSGKSENLDPILSELEKKVIDEIRSVSSISYNKLKKEHMDAWSSMWRSGFGISNSLAVGAMNGDQINATMYYLLSNSRAPLIEHRDASSDSANLKYQMERCYEGFSTLHAVKLWKLPKNENEISSLHSLWALTLEKHGCKNLLELGAEGLLQAVILSIGGLKFNHHHLDLNLNPRQLHRNYYFRNLNYENTSLISIDVEVGNDNHAQIYVTLNHLIDPNRKFYACDAGCIDEPIDLPLNSRIQFPVKLTDPPTAILYVSSDKDHINELKHILHVQEVDIAPSQDVNAIAIHRHGHHLAGLATLFWTLFVILIIIFHLFLIKLVYREMFSGSPGANDKNSYSSYDANKKYRYSRTV